MELGMMLALSAPGREMATAAGPPWIVAPLGDLSLTEGQPMTPVDLSAGFGGANLAFALAPASAPLPSGLSLSPSGLLSGTPVGAAAALTVVVRASNTAGAVESAFQLGVSAMLLQFRAELSGLTANPTHGATAESGTALQAEALDFSGAAPTQIGYQWKTRETGAIAGAVQSSFAPNAALLDGQTLYCTISAAPYPEQDTPEAVVRHVPPQAAGALADEILDLGSGPATVAAGADFTGEALVFSVTGPGCSIDPATGIVTIQTSAPTIGAPVTVAAQNSGGQAVSIFQLTVEDLDAEPGPEFAVPVVDEVADSFVLSVSESSTIYWRRDAAGTNPDAVAVIGGGGFDSGSFQVTAGTNEIDIVFADGNDGPQEISFVAAVTPDAPSVVRTVAVNIDTAAPALVTGASTPAAGATGVAAAAPVTLVFSETVVAGSGTIEFRRIADGSLIEAIAIGSCTITGANVAVPHAAFPEGAAIGIGFGAGTLRDLAGNPVAAMPVPGAFGFTVAAAAPSLGASVVPTSFADPVWASQTLDQNGWWRAPASNARADTDGREMVWSAGIGLNNSRPPAGITITAVVDVRRNAAADGGLGSLRLWNVTTGQSLIVQYDTRLTTGLQSQDSGAINMGGGVWRLWQRMVIGATSGGERIIMDVPQVSGGDIQNDYRTPRLFEGALTEIQIGGIV